MNHVPERDSAGAATAPARLLPGLAVTIRGKIIMAFCAFAALIAVLGLAAFHSVVDSGRLVVATYDKPLMAISYARLALANFMAMELASAQRNATTKAAEQAALDTHIRDLARAIAEDLAVAEERSSSVRPSALAHETARAVADWEALRERLLGEPLHGADNAILSSLAASVLSDLDNLVELTADDGFKLREQALASIETYRRLSLAATLAALVLGAAIAFLLLRHTIRPIASASRAARLIAEGQLNVEIVRAGGDELGQLLEAMNVMRNNLRDMREREAIARHSPQARLVDAIANCEAGIILVDGDGRIVISNAQPAAFLSASPADLGAGLPLPAPLDAAVGELCLADGHWFHLTRSRTPEGGFLLIASDITTLRQRETALRAAKEQAEAASRAQTDFLAKISHQLRLPVNELLGTLELLASGTGDPVDRSKYPELGREAGRSVNHLREIIDHILDIAKLQAGKMRLARESTRLGEVIEDAVRAVKERAQSQGIIFTCEVDTPLPLVDADPARLRQVLVNLLSNAIKFTAERGLIVLTARREGEGVRIAVSDTGIGMAVELIPEALEPFRRGDGDSQPPREGVGLGLPISKLLVEQHGGRLLVESTPGRGTTVSIILPCIGPEASRLAVAG